MTDLPLDWHTLLKENMSFLLQLEMLVHAWLVEGVQIRWEFDSRVLLQHLSICTVTVPHGSGKDFLTLLLLPL